MTNTSKNIHFHLIQGENSTTCDPWTSRDFMDEMRSQSTRCHHCLSDCNDITYLPTITSAEFRWSSDMDISIKILDFLNSPIAKFLSACVIPGIWTWVPSATWPWPPWQCGNRASSRPTATRQPVTSIRHRGRWGWNTQTPWVRGSSYLPLPRFYFNIKDKI